MTSQKMCRQYYGRPIAGQAMAINIPLTYCLGDECMSKVLLHISTIVSYIIVIKHETSINKV